MDEKNFTEFMDECRKKANTLGDLPSLLITPIQRMPRYELLIRELIKDTPENHVDYLNLLEAKKTIEKLCRTFNMKKQEQETRRKLFDIQQAIISPAPMLLMAPHRLYVRDGPLQFTHKGQMETSGQVFLFNDIMLLTKTKKEKDRKGEVTRYPYVTTITLKNTTFKGKDTTQKKSFYLVQENDQWEFYCNDDDHKREWTTAIHETMEMLSLNEMLDSGIDESGSKIFSVLKATYGYLKDPTQIVDVTQVVQDIVKQQGGAQLVLNAGSKAPVFGDPARILKKRKLLLVYSLKGSICSKVFQDADPIKLPETTH